MKIQIDLGKRTWKFELSSTKHGESAEGFVEEPVAGKRSETAEKLVPIEQATPTRAAEGRPAVAHAASEHPAVASSETERPSAAPQAAHMTPADPTDGFTDEQLFAVTYGYGEPPVEDPSVSSEEPTYTPGPAAASEPAVPAKPKRKWLKRILIGAFVIVTMPFLWFAYLFGLIVWTLKIGGIIR